MQPLVATVWRWGSIDMIKCKVLAQRTCLTTTGLQMRHWGGAWIRAWFCGVSSTSHFHLAKMKKKKAGSTLKASQAIPHPSTNWALCRLTSEVKRDLVHSTRYGRQRWIHFLWHKHRKHEAWSFLKNVDKHNFRNCPDWGKYYPRETPCFLQMFLSPDEDHFLRTRL